MSECQTKAGNQECLNVWMFWTTFVFMCKLKSDCLACCHMSSNVTFHMSHVLCWSLGHENKSCSEHSNIETFLVPSAFFYFETFSTVGPLRIGDDVITKDSLFVIIVEIDTWIYKTYPKLDYTIVHPKYPRDSLSSIYIMQWCKQIIFVFY